MSKGYRYLSDEAFLKKIDELHIKEQHIRVATLEFMTEKPIRNIEGEIVGGTLNLDGNSAVRRTCNFTMIAPSEENNIASTRNTLSINKKVEVEIGFTNTTNQYKEYDVIWFPLGVFVIANVSISNSTSGLSISLQLKDKMCLLNGECGGVIPASTQFDMYETIDETGKYIIEKPVIYQIITELVNHFGGEDLGRIIISDVPDRIKQVMKWTGSKPLYLYNTSKTADNYTATLNEKDINGFTKSNDVNITLDAGEYRLYELGDNVGYIYTDFVYPNELIADAGSTVCDILDNIKNLLGNYEYFYDIQGNFRFQEIKNYTNNAESTTSLKEFTQLTGLTEDHYIFNFTEGKSVYSFDNGNLITTYSNAPQYNMIKNDFIVWGMRTTAEGLQLPIRYHLAIDKKPTIDKQTIYHRWLYTDPDTNVTCLRAAVRYDKAKGQAFPQPGSVDYYYTYGDGSNTSPVYYWDAETLGYVQLDAKQYYKKVTVDMTTDWRYLLYLMDEESMSNGAETSRYYAEMKTEFPKIFDVVQEKYINDVDGHSLDYWLDFIDSNAAIQELNVDNIGVRSKAVTESNINCLFEPAIPEVVYLKAGDSDYAQLRQEAIDNYVKWSNVSEAVYDALIYGGGFNPAYDLVRSLLYQYTSYNEGITLQVMPIYHLEPNTRISVLDSASGISGDYVINNMSIPLDINGIMSISCTRALERL